MDNYLLKYIAAVRDSLKTSLGTWGKKYFTLRNGVLRSLMTMNYQFLTSQPHVTYAVV